MVGGRPLKSMIIRVPFRSVPRLCCALERSWLDVECVLTVLYRAVGTDIKVRSFGACSPEPSAVLSEHLYVETLNGEIRTFVDLVSQDPRADVKQYPDWTLERLGQHLGVVHRWATAVLVQRSKSRLPRTRREAAVAPSRADLPQWLRDGVDLFIEAYKSAADSRAEVWAPGSDHRPIAWLRRMTLETSIHRWDAEVAVGKPSAIDPQLAADGVDEFLDVYLPRVKAAGVEDARVELVSREPSRRWLLEFGDARGYEQPLSGVRTGRLDGDASTIWLLLMDRAELDAVQTASSDDLLVERALAAVAALRSAEE